jgi:oligoribonuclease
MAQGVKKHGKHEALADIYESISEMKHYREHFIKL